MSDLPEFVDVILPLPVQNFFTYKVSEEQSGKIRSGSRVTVQFGKRKIYTALVRKVHNIKPGGYYIKNIISILDAVPLVNEIQLKFWEWIADYYICSTGEVFKTALPAGLKSESETKVFPASVHDQNIELNKTELLILDVLMKKNVMTVREIESLANKKDVMPIIRSMLDKGAIFLEEQLKERYKPKLQAYIRLNPDISDGKELDNIIELLEKAPRQLELLLGYLNLSNPGENTPAGEVDKLLLLKSTQASGTTLNSLIKKGILEICKKEVSRLT